jgi:hypothetical protein
VWRGRIGLAEAIGTIRAVLFVLAMDHASRCFTYIRDWVEKRCAGI